MSDELLTEKDLPCRVVTHGLALLAGDDEVVAGLHVDLQLGELLEPFLTDGALVVRTLHQMVAGLRLRSLALFVLISVGLLILVWVPIQMSLVWDRSVAVNIAKLAVVMFDVTQILTMLAVK